jgi:hypothetical protein
MSFSNLDVLGAFHKHREDSPRDCFVATWKTSKRSAKVTTHNTTIVCARLIAFVAKKHAQKRLTTTHLRGKTRNDPIWVLLAQKNIL